MSKERDELRDVIAAWRGLAGPVTLDWAIGIGSRLADAADAVLNTVWTTAGGKVHCTACGQIHPELRTMQEYTAEQARVNLPRSGTQRPP